MPWVRKGIGELVIGRKRDANTAEGSHVFDVIQTIFWQCLLLASFFGLMLLGVDLLTPSTRIDSLLFASVMTCLVFGVTINVCIIPAILVRRGGRLRDFSWSWFPLVASPLFAVAVGLLVAFW